MPRDFAPSNGKIRESSFAMAAEGSPRQEIARYGVDWADYDNIWNLCHGYRCKTTTFSTETSDQVAYYIDIWRILLPQSGTESSKTGPRMRLPLRDPAIDRAVPAISHATPAWRVQAHRGPSPGAATRACLPAAGRSRPGRRGAPCQAEDQLFRAAAQVGDTAARGIAPHKPFESLTNRSFGRLNAKKYRRRCMCMTSLHGSIAASAIVQLQHSDIFCRDSAGGSPSRRALRGARPSQPGRV